MTSPEDARSILNDYTADVVRHFIATEAPEIVSHEKMKLAELRLETDGFGEALQELLSDLSERAKTLGVPVDDRLRNLANELPETLEELDGAAASQLDAFRRESEPPLLREINGSAGPDELDGQIDDLDIDPDTADELRDRGVETLSTLYVFAERGRLEKAVDDELEAVVLNALGNYLEAHNEEHDTSIGFEFVESRLADLDTDLGA